MMKNLRVAVVPTETGNGIDQSSSVDEILNCDETRLYPVTDYFKAQNDEEIDLLHWSFLIDIETKKDLTGTNIEGVHMNTRPIQGKMNKKEFKAKCNFHEYGRGKNKRNAIYFDWKTDTKNNAVGFKYMVKASVENCLKTELFNALFDWVTKEKQPSWWVEYRIATREQDRFKVSIMG